MQRRTNDFKLPAIQQKIRENQTSMTNTITTTSFNSKTRPSSLTKVEDLQKKLFNKLDSYETVTKVNTGKRVSRKDKGVLIEALNDNQKQAEGYQKLQKLMPQLYTKLIDAKKVSSSMMDIFPSNTEPSLIRAQTLLSRQISIGESSSKVKELKSEKIEHFVTSSEQNLTKSQQMVMSQQQMEEIFQQYIKQQGFTKQTSKQQLEILGKSIGVCEKQIQSLTKTMESLIREIGIQCITACDNDKQKEY